ncbi:hypothetical protein SLEP1_g48378 [Rubroshorea leprosula]|uniref:Uncharacterized protein n=1 Tax=Rubroshorea leprosula TaxID=152421 RepID=A0AAV5LTE0_9ROSI|nr:hypothetical protein SLEP1_g48378 [Rubroshorea leprosula]
MMPAGKQSQFNFNGGQPELPPPPLILLCVPVLIMSLLIFLAFSSSTDPDIAYEQFYYI